MYVQSPESFQAIILDTDGHNIFRVGRIIVGSMWLRASMKSD